MIVDMSRMLSTAQAAARLGVKPSTLYAYVSRGTVTRHLGPDGRSSRFEADEIELLARRGRPRRSSRDPSVEVIVESALTQIPAGAKRRGGHLYRGESAVSLARTATFEEVAALLLGRPESLEVMTVTDSDGVSAGMGALAGMRISVEIAAGSDPMRTDLSPASVTAAATRIIGAMVDSVAAGSGSVGWEGLDGKRRRRTVAGRLAVGLSGRSRPAPWVAEGINAALVLLADHEMATSTLAARVAASTRADPYACVVAALATLSGPLHGGASTVVLAALQDDDPVQALARSAGSGSLPGFGHPLYSGTDPRASVLLERVDRSATDHRVAAAARALARSVNRRSGVSPNVDLGLAALVGAGGLRADAGEVIFAVARCAGWLAHVAEEYSATPLRYRSRAVAIT